MLLARKAHAPATPPPETPLSEVHNAMARLERDLRRAVPDIVRVQIDPEPAEDERRKAKDERPTIAVEV